MDSAGFSHCFLERVRWQRLRQNDHRLLQSERDSICVFLLLLIFCKEKNSIPLLQKHNFDGVVLELWLQYGRVPDESVGRVFSMFREVSSPLPCFRLLNRLIGRSSFFSRIAEFS